MDPFANRAWNRLRGTAAWRLHIAGESLDNRMADVVRAYAGFVARPSPRTAIWLEYKCVKLEIASRRFLKARKGARKCR